MKIDSFSVNNSQYRQNINQKASQGHSFAKKLNDTVNFNSNQNMSQAVDAPKKVLANTDKFFISTHNLNSSKPTDSANIIENAKKAVMKDMTPKTDSAQVQKIKEQIKTGSYEIDVNAIAKKVIEFYGVLR